ncbi:MAG: S-layer homology domain-containing protein [bacterium]|nr:S-layer homology domain-containing protein [bacterium]
MKKGAVILFSGIIALFASHPVFAEELNDISGHQNETAIRFLYENHVISGYSDGSFQPERTINRAELLKILVGGKGLNPSVEEYHNCFPDVQDEWFAPFICYALDQGWVNGYPDGSFQPSRNVNKVEAIKMLVNSQGYAVKETVEEILYDDVQTSDWFAPFIEVAGEKGLLEEDSNTFGITDEMTRGDIGENIYRVMIIVREGLSSFSEYQKQEQRDGQSEIISWYNVIKVVDGDTITVDIKGENTTVRLIGIDTPESVDPRKPVQCFSTQAKKKVEDLLNTAQVRLESDSSQSDKDIYNRLLRYVYLQNGSFVNEVLIREGFAREYTYDKPYQYQAQFREAENEARIQGRGLWAEDACVEESVPAEIQPIEPTSEITSIPDCGRNAYNCGNFNTQAESQSVFEFCWKEVGYDIHRLDRDRDGEACESLP